jgi:hypothetical protein
MRAGTCAACEQKARHAERVPRATVARSPPWQGPRGRDQRAQKDELSCALSVITFEGEVYGSIYMYAGANNRCNEKKSKTCVTRRRALVARNPIDSKIMVLHATFDEAPDGRKKEKQVTGDEEGRRKGPLRGADVEGGRGPWPVYARPKGGIYDPAHEGAGRLVPVASDHAEDHRFGQVPDARARPVYVYLAFVAASCCFVNQAGGVCLPVGCFERAFAVATYHRVVHPLP